METIVINERRQSFNGANYYLCGNYFQHGCKRLHRAVWEYHNGPIPSGYHVHHKDEDRSNNNIENLELLPATEHLSRHSSKEENCSRMREQANKYRHLAEPWHHTQAAKEVASAVIHKIWENAPYKEYTCQMCGKSFTSRALQGAKYCGNNCKARALRRRRRLEKCQKLSLLNAQA